MKKKALLVTRVSGFVPQFEIDAVHILQDMGYEVHYAANFDQIVYGKDNDRARQLGLICHSIPFARKLLCHDNWKAYKMLVELMRKEHFELVHCHMPLTGVLARMAAKKTNTAPVIYTGHGFHFYTGASVKHWIFYPVERFMAGYTDGLVTINEEDYQRAKRFPVRGKVYRMHGVGIDCEHFVKRAEQNVDRESKKDQTLWKEKIILLTVGELAPGKNHMAVLEALALLSDMEIGYYICGEGQCREELQERAKELHIEKQVHFLGYRSDVATLLKKADIFVFPSLREGMPVAVMEAMTMACAVIAYDIRGCRELIVDQKGGILLKDKKTEALAKAIQELAKDAAKREEMGRFNQNKVKEYSNEVVKRERRSIYEEVRKH